MHPNLGVIASYADPIRGGTLTDFVPVAVVGVALLLLAAALVIVAVRARAAIDHHDPEFGRR